MKPSIKISICLLFAVGFGLLWFITKPTIEKRLLVRSFLAAEPLSPYIEFKYNPDVLKWNSVIEVDGNVSVQLDATTIPTIGSFLQYSDEKDSRHLPKDGFVDYPKQDFRVDPKAKILYIRTGGTIWSMDHLNNICIFKFDLLKRKVVLWAEYPPGRLPPPPRPWPKPA